MTGYDESPTEVRPGVWRTAASVKSGPFVLSTNAYLIVDGGEAALVDTAWPMSDADFTHLERLFEVSGVPRAAVHTIVMTHAHRDHAGFGELVAGWTGAEVILHEDEKSTVGSLSGYQGLPGEDEAVRWYEGHGFPRQAAVDIVRGKLTDRELEAGGVRWVADGEVITVGDRSFEVIATPGHTPGHLCLLEQATGLLFSGDALLPRGHGNPHVTVRAFTPPDPLTDYVVGLERLAARGDTLTVCLPGHGPEVDDPRGLIRTHLDYADEKLNSIDEALEDVPATAYEVVSRMPWRRGTMRFDELTGDELFLAFGDSLARIRRMVTLGRAEAIESNGVTRYRRAA